MSQREVMSVLGDALRAESLRRTLLEAVRQNGQHVTALLIGIPRAVLRRALAMSNPRPSTLERIREWALDFPDPEIAAGTVALAVVANEFPAPHRLWARRRLAQTIAAMHSACGHPPSEWLIEECSTGAPDVTCIGPADSHSRSGEDPAGLTG
jgi:hypothetical protein